METFECLFLMPLNRTVKERPWSYFKISVRGLGVSVMDTSWYFSGVSGKHPKTSKVGQIFHGGYGVHPKIWEVPCGHVIHFSSHFDLCPEVMFIRSIWPTAFCVKASWMWMPMRVKPRDAQATWIFWEFLFFWTYPKDPNVSKLSRNYPQSYCMNYHINLMYIYIYTILYN